MKHIKLVPEKLNEDSSKTSIKYADFAAKER